MALYISSLNSGSNGNCYYIGNGTEAVLIDAGLSCRETERRIRQVGLSLQQVKAIFISHEHIDHIKGAELLSKRYALPVFITGKTLQNSHLRLDDTLIRPWTTDSTIEIGRLKVTSFPKPHDAADACSFVVSGSGINIGVFTDIGQVSGELIARFRSCHAAFLEANYDEEMLEKGSYPFHLKRRIRGGNGHLSNSQAFELFVQHRQSQMSHLLLAHLSKENNCPEKVMRLFQESRTDVSVSVASRYGPGAVLKITGQKQALEQGHAYPQATVKQAVLF